MAYRTLITRLLSTFLISCSPGSNSSDKPLTSASGPLHVLFPTLGSYPPRLCKPASLISFRSLFKCYKRKGRSRRESMPKLLLLSPPHEGPHGAHGPPATKYSDKSVTVLCREADEGLCVHSLYWVLVTVPSTY